MFRWLLKASLESMFSLLCAVGLGGFVVVVIPRFLADLLEPSSVWGVDWKDTQLVLPSDAPAIWKEAFTDSELHTASGRLPVGEVLGGFPVACLLEAPKFEQRFRELAACSCQYRRCLQSSESAILGQKATNSSNYSPKAVSVTGAFFRFRRPASNLEIRPTKPAQPTQETRYLSAPKSCRNKAYLKNQR